MYFTRHSRTALLTGVFLLIFVLFNLYYVPPVRNLVLKPWLPHRWRAVSTSDILMMRQSKLPSNVTAITCPRLTKPGVTSVAESKMVAYKHATPDNPFFQDEMYSGFLPGISHQQRVDTLLIYSVMADTLSKIGVDFFFIGGSLLGVVRHAGSIPWDTDMDVALNVTHWEKVRAALSCVEGYELQVSWHMHWKFYFKGISFPFVDLFFITGNERYLWALNYYSLASVVFERKDVYPLKTSLYEGILVPVPLRAEFITRSEFDLEYCYPPHKSHLNGKYFKKTVVLCSSMAEFYPVINTRF